nr:putative LPS assembly protein LptD [Avrilella dinanensis]
MQTKVIYIVLHTFCILGCGFFMHAQEIPSKKDSISIENKQDSLFIESNNITANDSIKNHSKSKPKQGLEAIVYRDAKDYEKLDQKNKTLTLYNEAVFKYQDFELKAGIIVYNYEKEELYAGRIKDSLGNYTQLPEFKQGAQQAQPDSIRFNMKSQKAFVWNTRSKYDEFNIMAEKTKKENDSTYFQENVIFTTAEDIENPEYYFKTRKLKLIPNKKIVTGVTNMVIADVPTPIGLPFAFFPLSSGAVSGFIIPSFGENNARGYFLQNGGYYFAFSDKLDVTLSGDYYTNGSYRLQGQSSYANRYKYSGYVNLSYENLIEGEIGFPDYFRAQNYNIQWSHSQDAKANPTSRFSASVNLGSSNYFRQSMNTQNMGAALNNTMSSSVSYSKTFQSVPQVNMTISANHNQNINTQRITMSLPNFNASVDRIYPFAPKNGSKKGIFQNINLQYNVSARNQINTTDSLFFKKQMFDEMNTGVQHSIPISTNFKLFRYFSVSMNANYNEVWYLNTIKKYYDSQENRVIDERVNGFDAFRTYNFSANLGTTLYGTFNFGDDKKIQAIRHVVRPSVSYTYTPSFEQYYDSYAIDANGTTMEEYTRFQSGIFGSPGQQMSNMMSFSLGNSFEAKVRDDDSPDGEPKKVMLLNNLNLSTSYNMTADSLKLAPVRISTGTTILNNKMQINLGTTIDPYAVNNSGQRIDMLNIDNGGSLFRLTSANVTVNYSLSSTDPLFGNPDKDMKTKKNVQSGGRADDLFGQSVDLADNRVSMFDQEETEERKPDKFYNNSLPWNLTIAYSLTYNNARRNNEISNNSLMFSGNITLSPGWMIGFSSGYDFKNKGVTYTQLRFERDLKSWRMNFTWIPNGYNKQWNFFIGISSSILQDIKYEKRNSPDRIYR